MYETKQKTKCKRKTFYGETKKEIIDFRTEIANSIVIAKMNRI